MKALFGVLIVSILLASWQASYAQEATAFPFPFELRSSSATNAVYRAGSANGHEFRVFEDGSGHVGGWRIRSCEVDAMTDQRRCTIQNRQGPVLEDGEYDRIRSGPLTLVFGPEGVERIHLSPWAAQLFPGSTQYVRVDDEAPLEMQAGRAWSGVRARTLLERLRTAQRIRTRHYEWPYESPRDSEIGPFAASGFDEALLIVKWVLSEL